MAAQTKGVKVVYLKDRDGYRVDYKVQSPQRNRKATRSFFYAMSQSSASKKENIDANMLRNIMKEIIGKKTVKVMWETKPSSLKTELAQYVNRILKSVRSGDHKKRLGFGIKGGDDSDSEDSEGSEEKEMERESDLKSISKKDPPLPKNKSMFQAEPESANTKVYLAPSFSGKTTLMVSELNKLTNKQLEEYDKIILFTESTAASPLKNINPRVSKRLKIFDRFIPSYVLLLRKINIATNNQFRFLIMLDDCLNLKSDILIKMILTLRNSNISTVISIQYSKLLSKSQRQSIHDYYLMNLKIEDLEYLMSGFLASHFRDLFEREGIADRESIMKMTYKQLAEKAVERLKGKCLHFAQREDKIYIYDRELDKKGKKKNKKSK